MAKNGPISTFGLRFVKAVLAAIVVILCSRWLNATGRGELSVILFWLHAVVLFYEIVGGSPIANLIRNKPLGTIVPAVWIWSIIAGLLGALSIYFFTDLPVGWMMLIYFPLAWLGTHYNYYQGLEKAFVRNNLQVMLEVLKLLILLIYYLLVPNLTVTHVLVVYAIAHLAVYAMSRWILRPFFKLAKEDMGKPDKSLFAFGITNQMAAIVQFFSNRVGVILLAKYVSDAEAGVFSNVLLMADTVWIFAHSFGSIAHMRFLRSDNPVFVARLLGKYISLVLIGTSAAVLIILCLPASFYQWVFGSDFGGMRAISLAAIPGIIALAFSTILAHYLHAKNKFKLILIATAFGLITQLIFQYLWIETYKGVGSAMAFSLGLMVSAFFLWCFSKKTYRLSWRLSIRQEIRLLRKMLIKLF